jgi:hypothetical protein
MPNANTWSNLILISATDVGRLSILIYAEGIGGLDYQAASSNSKASFA